MYTFSSKLKTFSFILMVLGILGIGYGFLTAPKDIEEVQKILDADAHGHGTHGAAATHETTHEAHEMPKVVRAEEHAEAEPAHETHAVAEADTTKASPLSDTIAVDSAKAVGRFPEYSPLRLPRQP